MKTFAAALLFLGAQAGPAVHSSEVCVTNSAGFVMDFYFNDLVTGEKSSATDRYPIDQTKCVHISKVLGDVKEGDLIMTYVKAIAGTTNSVSTAVVYDASAPAITFTCTGTTLNYSCPMNGEDEAEKIARFITDMLQ